MSALPLQPVRAPAVLPWACSACLVADSSGTHGPGAWVGEECAYRYEPGEWLCRGCSAAAWGAYLERKRERLALIAASAVLGWPARRSDLARLRAAGAQLSLFSGSEGKGSSSPPAQASPPPASAPLATPMSLGGEVEGTGRCSPQAPSPSSGTWRAA